jgi:hypothetical protein
MPMGHNQGSSRESARTGVPKTINSEVENNVQKMMRFIGNPPPLQAQ